MQILHICILLMCLLHSNGRICQSNKKPLRITILYESLCPDSQAFLLKFLPIYEEFYRCINLTLVPFGKAEISSIQVSCQHGPNECWGNAFQSCALHTNLTQLQKAKFVACHMKNFMLNSKRDYKCSKLLQVEGKVRSCMLSDKAMKYQRKDEAITFRYPFESVPVVIFNGVYRKSLQESAILNVRQTLCKQLYKLHNRSVEGC